MYINRSLSFLEQVIIARSDSSRDHVPYRQSKLTHLLRESLGIRMYMYYVGVNKTSMLLPYPTLYTCMYLYPPSPTLPFIYM